MGAASLQQLELPLCVVQDAPAEAPAVEYELREVIWPLTGERFLARFPVEPALSLEYV